MHRALQLCMSGKAEKRASASKATHIAFFLTAVSHTEGYDAWLLSVGCVKR